MLPTAVILTKNPVIRNAEGGALLLSIIEKKFINQIDFSRLQLDPQVFTVPEDMTPSLKFTYYVLGLLNNRFEKLQEHFLEDQAEYSNNLIHGLITTLGHLIQNLSNNTEIQGEKDCRHFRQLFHDLSEVIAKVLSYATKLSADNISTCILDNNITAKKFNDLQGKLSFYCLLNYFS